MQEFRCSVWREAGREAGAGIGCQCKYCTPVHCTTVDSSYCIFREPDKVLTSESRWRWWWHVSFFALYMYVPSKKLCVGAGGACWEGDDGADFTQVTHEGLKSARASKEKGGFFYFILNPVLKPNHLSRRWFNSKLWKFLLKSQWWSTTSLAEEVPW